VHGLFNNKVLYIITYKHKAKYKIQIGERNARKRVKTYRRKNEIRELVTKLEIPDGKKKVVKEMAKARQDVVGVKCVQEFNKRS